MVISVHSYISNKSQFFIPIKGDGYPTTSRAFEKVIKS